MTTFANAEIHVDDVGTSFEVTLQDGNGTAVDISGATKKELHFLKADGTVLEVTAQFKTDGKDGVLTYDTVAGNLDVAGEWSVQPYVEMPGWSGHAGIERFTVYENTPEAPTP